MEILHLGLSFDGEANSPCDNPVARMRRPCLAVRLAKR